MNALLLHWDSIAKWLMRFDLRLHGETKDGRKCLTEVSVYARSESQLKREAQSASETADWHHPESGEDVKEGSEITVMNVEQVKRKPQYLRRKKAARKKKKKKR